MQKQILISFLFVNSWDSPIFDLRVKHKLKTRMQNKSKLSPADSKILSAQLKNPLKHSLKSKKDKI